MRVIAGTLRGRRLRAPKGHHIRPTGDRLKGTLFNIIQSRIEGARFLDAFSGTGAIGIEALSRGAAAVIFIDARESAGGALRENLEHCAITGGFRLLEADIFVALRRLAREGERLDILFLDPPYDWSPYEELVGELFRCGLAGTHSLVIVEHHRRAALPEAGPGYRRMRRAVQGEHCLSFYSAVPTDPDPHDRSGTPARRPREVSGSGEGAGGGFPA
jgi:16S rRNA (guanine966-N2)-methyltransferase